MANLKKETTKTLFNRVYNDKMIVADVEKDVMGDEAEIIAVIERVFNDGSANPDPAMLFQFNQLVIELAQEVAKPLVSDLLSMLANFKTSTRGNIVMIELPKKIKSKVIWSANGSGVDLIRVEGKSKTVAVPHVFTAGFYYEPLDLVQDSVDMFRGLVNDLAEAKLRLYMTEVASIIDTAVSATDIPANNVINGANTSISDYNVLVSRAMRFGGRPILIADPVMINDLAGKINADANLTNLITDKYKDEMLVALQITTLGRSTAFNLINPFIDSANTTVELDIKKGYMVAGEGSQKPLSIVEYGAMRQMTEQNIEDERIKIKIAQDASIMLVFTQNFFYIKDTALTL